MNYKSTITNCALFALLLLGHHSAVAQNKITVKIQNETDSKIAVKKIVMNRAARTFDVIPVTTISANNLNGTATVEEGADLEFYWDSAGENSEPIGYAVEAKNNRKVVFRKPGLTFNIKSMRCDQINSAEPSWDIEVGMTCTVTVRHGANLKDTQTAKRIWGDEKPDGTNRGVGNKNDEGFIVLWFDSDADPNNNPAKNYKHNLWKTTFNMPAEDVGKATLKVDVTDAFEDDNSGNDILAVSGSGATHENIDARPVTKDIVLEEKEYQKATLTYEVTTVKTFEVIGGN